ncbi:MAG: transglutaminase-like domain-containing protein, partial [Thermoanaerobaculia bacterium]|nr:transglutaminase-like domain-containing protein [Thermoanaerobaculia bacterium]
VLLGRLGLSDVYIGTAVVGPTVYGAPEKQGPRPNNAQLFSAPGFGVFRARVGSLLEDKKTKCPVPATIASVGFKNDFTITRWGDKTTVDEPDGCTPTWSRSASQGQNDNSPVAYIKETLPRIFGMVAINPSMPDTVTVSLRLLWNGQIAAFKRGLPITGGSAETRDIDFLTPLAHDVEETNPTFQWEMSYDERNWWPVGASGPHKVYWTQTAPMLPAFPVDPSAVLYDASLEWVCTSRARFPDAGTLPLALSQFIRASVRYSDAAGNTLHPLDAPGIPDGIQCIDHAVLMTGLLRSVGIEAWIEYLVNGADGKAYRYRKGTNEHICFQARAAVEDFVEQNPHFTFHALVRVPSANDLFDPVYGRKGRPTFMEAVVPVDPPRLTTSEEFPILSAAGFFSVEQNVYTQLVCPH